MKSTAVISMGIVLWVGAARAEVTASLTVAEQQDERFAPYRSAELSLDNAGPTAVETVLLRPVGGGPSVRYSLAVAPGSSARQRLALPAIRAVQTYELTALDAAGGLVGQAAATITWPEELVATDDFIDAAYKPWLDEQTSWPEQVRGNAILLLAIFVTATAGALFIPRAALRAGAVALVVILVAAAVPQLLRPEDALKTSEYALLRFGGDEPPRVESFLVISARRTRRARYRAPAPPYPVYPDRAAADGDDAEAEPFTRRISLTVRPGGVRVIRPAPWKPRPPSTSPAGSIRRDEGSTTIRARFPGISGGMILDDSFWPIAPDDTQVTDHFRQTVPAKAPLSIWELLSPMTGPTTPASETPRATNRAPGSKEAQLLNYWRRKYQRAGRAYLVNFALADGQRSRIEVLELRWEAATAPAAATRPVK